MWISDDALDASLPLPRGSRDIPLMICDRSFDRKNQLTNPFSDSAHAPNDGIVGNRILVNGAVLPHHRVHACRYRLRILNASQFRNYNLVFEGGVTVTQIGTEAGLMPKPLKRRRILIGAAERVDLIVDFSRAKHSNVVLKSVRRGNSPGGIGSRAYAGPLMQFRVGKPIPDSTSVPAALRPLPGWVESAPQSPSKTWTISIGKGFAPPWLINGRTFDPAYVEHRPKLGTVETWKLVNKTTATHLLHIHHTDWYLLSRNGKPPPPWEDCLKETFLMDPGETLLVAGRFSDYPGKFVIH
jgi:FtsP/CotA-like multicopper oxidase with cupredoxin domain